MFPSIVGADQPMVRVLGRMQLQQRDLVVALIVVRRVIISESVQRGDILHFHRRLSVRPSPHEDLLQEATRVEPIDGMYLSPW